MRSALAALVAIGIGDDANARANREGIVQQPVEGAPVRVHLDRALQHAVMGVVQVGVAATDMGHAQHLLGLGAQGGVQGADIQRIGGLVAEVLDQRARGAADGAALPGEDHVAVAAKGGVARPFVARQEDEAARRVEGGEGAVEVGPA